MCLISILLRFFAEVLPNALFGTYSFASLFSLTLWWFLCSRWNHHLPSLEGVQEMKLVQPCLGLALKLLYLSKWSIIFYNNSHYLSMYQDLSWPQRGGYQHLKSGWLEVRPSEAAFKSMQVYTVQCDHKHKPWWHQSQAIWRCPLGSCKNQGSWQEYKHSSVRHWWAGARQRERGEITSVPLE